jgi:pyruvate/2-oxoglutarate dehydrogenase complex dihydrolipoamide acyltransferase (E2) component
MPALGADMEAGTLVEWLIKPGDRVKKGDVIAVVETEKGAIEVEIFDEGIVGEIVAPIGTKVPVGGLLARSARARRGYRQRQSPRHRRLARFRRGRRLLRGRLHMSPGGRTAKK